MESPGHEIAVGGLIGGGLVAVGHIVTATDWFTLIYWVVGIAVTLYIYFRKA